MPDPAVPSHRTTDYFDYELPSDRIAQVPVEPRDAARLLVDLIDGADTEGGHGVAHSTVAELARWLRPGDVVVVNDTKVSPARLNLTKATGGKVEVLLLEPIDGHGRWEALVRGGRRVRPGTELFLDGESAVVVGDERGEGVRTVEVVVERLMERAGRLPLPPYIRHPLEDDTRYQTIFATNPGSVAAPTAGLHMTPEVVASLEAVGVDVVRVELRVGLGTFRPITADRLDDHQMHAETYLVGAQQWDRIRSAQRVVAVGTTVVRTLESVAATGSLAGNTDLFISRGYRWQVVDVLLTNFHVPRSSLLVLVDAFVGERWRDLYTIALAEGYRFLSFGDAMLIDRRHPG